MENKNIVVAFGGRSPEHEVSVITAIQAIKALEETDYTLIPLYISKEGNWFTGEYLMELDNYESLTKLKSNSHPCFLGRDEYGVTVLKETQKRGLFSTPKTYPIDTVLISFHGSDGENGAFQGLCEFYGLPYTGCNVLSSALGMDKVRAKTFCKSNDIPVVPGVDFLEQDWVEEQEQILARCTKLSYPLIIKPVHLGSSIGVQQAADEESLTEAVETAFRYDAHLLVEKAVQPLKEINCSVMGYRSNIEASVCERPKGRAETLTFEDKYQNDDQSSKGMASTDRVIPADIPAEQSTKIQNLSKKIFKLFGAAGIARLDFLVQADTQTVYFNEINTIPGSFSFYLWEESGHSFSEILINMIEISEIAHQEKGRRVQSYDTNLLSQKAVDGLKGTKGNKKRS